MHLLVGIYGKARAGKDTTGKYLEDQYGFVRTAFANYPKRVLMDLYGLSHAQMFGDELKEVEDLRYGYSPRYIMQYWLQACRHIDPHIWVRKCGEVINAARPERPIAVTDVRFVGEAEMIKQNKGLLWKVERTEAKASGGIEKHISEHDLDFWKDWDLILDNNSTFEHLYKQIDKYMKEISCEG